MNGITTITVDDLRVDIFSNLTSLFIKNQGFEEGREGRERMERERGWYTVRWILGMGDGFW